jgi:hypothetical protein
MAENAKRLSRPISPEELAWRQRQTHVTGSAHQTSPEHYEVAEGDVVRQLEKEQRESEEK